MRYLSTAGAAPGVNLAATLDAGLAPDGGLYVPVELPRFDVDRLDAGWSLSKLAAKLLAPFAAGSPLSGELAAICNKSMDLPLPLVELEPGRAWLMELFHGPTAAFKDFGARFLAASLERLQRPDDPPRTILVATSGDTGAAVAAAFHRRTGFRVVILFPDGRVSPRQAHQLGAFGENVCAYRVRGSFDDCQKLARQALNDADLAKACRLTTANSISLGRLLPQISYFAWAALQLDQRIAGGPVNIIVPTGNLGNALACVLARDMGLPIGEIRLATNANRTLADYFDGGTYRGRPGLETLANAMDVGDPGNFERLAWFYRDRDLRDAGLAADSVDDPAIQACIRRGVERYDRIFCPHTACAVEVLERRRKAGDRSAWLVAATAHPAKFDLVVEPLLGRRIQAPPALAELLARPSRSEPLAASYEDLRGHQYHSMNTGQEGMS